MGGETNGSISLSAALGEALDVVKDSMEMFTQAPAIYFVALALIGAGAGVAKRFVPMKRR